MTNMTWRQFKNHVDARLDEEGTSEDTPIWYIDVSYPQTSGYKHPTINSDDKDGIAID